MVLNISGRVWYTQGEWLCSIPNTVSKQTGTCDRAWRLSTQSDRSITRPSSSTTQDRQTEGKTWDPGEKRKPDNLL